MNNSLDIIQKSPNNDEKNTVDVNFNTMSWLKLNKAKNPLGICEGEYYVGDNISVIGLANCIGIGLVNENKKIGIATHISPFGGENYDSREFIEKCAINYLNILKDNIDFYPTHVIIRSREIGSRPLFHGSFIKLLSDLYSDCNINILNGTDFTINFHR